MHSHATTRVVLARSEVGHGQHMRQPTSPAWSDRCSSRAQSVPVNDYQLRWPNTSAFGGLRDGSWPDAEGGGHQLRGYPVLGQTEARGQRHGDLQLDSNLGRPTPTDLQVVFIYARWVSMGTSIRGSGFGAKSAVGNHLGTIRPAHRQTIQALLSRRRSRYVHYGVRRPARYASGVSFLPGKVTRVLGRQQTAPFLASGSWWYEGDARAVWAVSAG